MPAKNLFEYYTAQGKALPSVQDRAPLYAQQGGTGTYTGTAEQNTFLLGKLQASPTSSQPAVSGTVSSTNLNPETPVVIPPPPQQQSLIPDIDTLVTQFNAPSADQTKAQQEQTGILGRVESLINQQGQQGARKGELETQAGIPELSKQLNEINNQIRGINSSAFAATQTSENRLAPTFAIYGEQAQIERQKAVQTYGLAAASQALQGNIALAQDNVQRALSSEFDGIESKLKYQMLLLDRNRDSLNKISTDRTNALQIQLTERSRLLQEQKAERSGVYDVMLEAAKNGADNVTLNKILTATTREGALQISAPYFGKQKDFQFVGGTENQVSGVFDKTTGVFTPGVGGGGGPNVVKLTPEGKRNLSGAGFTPSEIDDIPRAIAQFGIDAVLKNVTDPAKREAIQKAYGVKVEEPSKLTRESLGTLYGIPDDNAKTDRFAGFLWATGKTNKEKLDELVSIVEKYRAVGYTDSQIMTLINKE